MTYTPEQLTPVYKQMVERISANLPTGIAERLVWNRKATPHGNKTDMILFSVWDRHQTGLEKNQFNYCLNYKPKRPEDGNRIWLLQVRFNIQRIRKAYPEVRDALRLKLRRLRNACPKPFYFRENEQTVELRYTFNFDRPLTSFPKFLAPQFVKLIETAHPIFMSAMDLFHRDAPLRTGLNVGVVSRRKREMRKDLSVFSSNIPAKMKLQILQIYDSRCAHCNKQVKRGDLEFHHLKFKSKGGLRIIENFAPLHKLCHDELHRVAGKDGVVPKWFLRLPRQLAFN